MVFLFCPDPASRIPEQGCSWLIVVVPYISDQFPRQDHIGMEKRLPEGDHGWFASAPSLSLKLPRWDVDT